VPEFVVGGGVIAGVQPPRQNFDQVILRDLGDAGRAAASLLGLPVPPAPPRTASETPGPAAGILNSAAGDIGQAALPPAPAGQSATVGQAAGGDQVPVTAPDGTLPMHRADP